MSECLLCLFRLHRAKGGVGACRGGCSSFGGLSVGSTSRGCGPSSNQRHRRSLRLRRSTHPRFDKLRDISPCLRPHHVAYHPDSLAGLSSLRTRVPVCRRRPTSRTVSSSPSSVTR